EIGGGCGYSAAVLAVLAARGISVEIIPALAAFARGNLKRTGRDHNITIVDGDGSGGYAPLAPYDAISVAAGAPDLPPQLPDQLKDPGVLVIPVGDLMDQELLVLTKENGATHRRVAGQCRFVPLRGGGGWF